MLNTDKPCAVVEDQSFRDQKISQLAPTMTLQKDGHQYVSVCVVGGSALLREEVVTSRCMSLGSCEHSISVSVCEWFCALVRKWQASQSNFLHLACSVGAVPWKVVFATVLYRTVLLH